MIIEHREHVEAKMAKTQTLHAHPIISRGTTILLSFAPMGKGIISYPGKISREKLCCMLCFHSERDSGREGSKEAHKYGKKRLVLISGYVLILVSYSVLMCSCLNLYFCLKKNTKLQLKIVLS